MRSTGRARWRGKKPSRNGASAARFLASGGSQKPLEEIAPHSFEPSEIAKAESTIEWRLKNDRKRKREEGFYTKPLTSPLPAARTVSASRSSASLLAASVASADAAS